MDFKQYQYVIRVSEKKSFTKAANSLFVSQPSLSAFIAKTEDEVGAMLFARSQNPLELTMAGEVFVQTGKQILQLHKNMQKQIVEIAQNKRGRMRVGIPGSRASYMMPLIYTPFHSTYPGIDFDMVESNSKTLLHMLQKGSIDLAIMPLFPIQDDLYSQLIYKEELLLIAKKDYLSSEDYLKKNTINIKKAANHPFILLKQGHGVRRALDSFFKNYQISPKILFETSNNGTALRIAAAGEGLAIVPKMTLEICNDIKGIEVLHLAPEGFFWDIAAIRKETDKSNVIQNNFVRIAQSVFQ